MADLEFLKSYLVGLGFAVDQPQLKKFEQGLKDAGGLVEHHTTGIVADLLKWQAKATSAFVAVSSGVIALADHVASSDQKFRLLGLRMLMTTQQTRSMQLSLDALGVTLEDAIWDPETRGRFIEMGAWQEKLVAQLGTGFEANMIKVRDLKFEFQKLGVTVEYVSMAFINRLVEKFGPQIDAIKAQLEKFLGYVSDHMDEWADTFADTVIPILKDTWDILKDVGSAVEALGLAFTNVMGFLSNDESIEGTEFNFRKMAKAIGDAADMVKFFLKIMTNAEQVVVHFASSLALLLSGNLKGAKAEAIKALSFLGPDGAALIGAIVGTFVEPGLGTVAGAMAFRGLAEVAGKDQEPGTQKPDSSAAPVADTPEQAKAKAYAAAIKPTTPETSPWGWVDDLLSQQPFKPAAKPASTSGSIRSQIDQAAAAHGVDPSLVEALANQESGQRQYDRSGRLIQSGPGAMGVMQLMPGTAKDLGVDATDTAQNIDGGVRMLRRLIDKYQSVPQALAAYNWGEGHVDKAIRDRRANIPDETTRYVQNIMAASGQPMTIGDIHINIMQPHATPDEIQKHVIKAVQAAQMRRTQRNVEQLGYVGG